MSWGWRRLRPRAPVPVVAVDVRGPTSSRRRVAVAWRPWRVTGRLHERRDGRAQAVGADHDPGAHLRAAPFASCSTDALDPSRARRTRPATWTRWRTLAPASTAASTRRRSSRARRGAESAGTPSAGLDRDVDDLVPVVEDRAVERAPAAWIRSRSPHRSSCSTPALIRACVDSVSLPSAAVHGEDPQAVPGAAAAPSRRPRREPRRRRRRIGQGSSRAVICSLLRVTASGRRAQVRSPGGRPAPSRQRPTPSMKLELRCRRKYSPSRRGPARA